MATATQRLVTIPEEDSVFTEAYTKERIDWYGMFHYERDGLKVRPTRVCGRCDHYFHKEFIIDLEVPAFLLDGELWMSLTPMEIQSAAVPLNLCEGTVGTGGLGMGYFALSAAESEAVEEVIVFERDERAINFFNRMFRDRDGFDKITVIHGDMHETCRNRYFDLLWVDTYQTMCPDEVITDITHYSAYNDIGTYRFWGQEILYYYAVMKEYTALGHPTTYPGITWQDRHLFTDFFSDDKRVSMRKGGTPWDTGPGEGYITNVFNALRAREEV